MYIHVCTSTVHFIQYTDVYMVDVQYMYLSVHVICIVQKKVVHVYVQYYVKCTGTYVHAGPTM
jgi:hypothetical protein